MTSIGVIQIIDRLHKDKRKRKESEYRVYPFNEYTYPVITHICKQYLPEVYLKETEHIKIILYIIKINI